MDTTRRTYEGIKLQISNLDLEIDQNTLYLECSKYGVVLNTEIKEGSEHCPVKAATVTYYSPGEAQTAMRSLNGKTLRKNILYVGQPPRERRPRSRSTNSFGKYGFSTNLNESWSEVKSVSSRQQSKLLENLQHSSNGLSSSWGNDRFRPNQSYGNSLIDFKKNITKGGCCSKCSRSGSHSHHSSGELR
uniref:RRM domain-containing protein n=1 Tax=Clytia hemisphaerica TaxID=252671 RepID=A0A7M5VDV5_9CNID|eukprot:TCONS_00006171-protein